MEPIFGKYRGTVTDSKDPLGRGRIQATAPSISDQPLDWAMPCLPYAGPQEGFYMIPPKGANVWVEFEGGDPNYPIWSGCFWWGDDEKQQPPIAAAGPEMKLIQTEKLALVLDDKAGKLTASLREKAAKDEGETMSLVMDGTGIVLTAKQVTVTLTPGKVEIKKGTTIVEVTDNIALKKPPATIEVSGSIALKNGAATAELTSSAINLKNGAASVAMSPAGVNINNGALEII